MRLTLFITAVVIALLSVLVISGCVQQKQPECVDKDNDGFGSANLQYCPSKEIDCDDSNPNVHPGMAEKCNGIDDDCDGTIDEGCECIEGETKQCGYSDVGACKYGIQRCVNGFWSKCEGAVMPQTEICENGIDEDCDGSDALCEKCREGLVVERCKCGSEIIESGYCCNELPSQAPCESEKDVIEILREFPLENGWQREEREKCYYWSNLTNTDSLVTSFLFENKELFCSYSPMYGWGKDVARAAFCIYKKGEAPDFSTWGRGTAPRKVIETQKYTIYLFAPCNLKEIPFIEKIVGVLEGKDAFEALKNFPLEEGWEIHVSSYYEVLDDTNTKIPTITFSNPELTCYYVMAGTKYYEKASLYCDFYPSYYKPKVAVFLGQPAPMLIKTKNYYIKLQPYCEWDQVEFFTKVLNFLKSFGTLVDLR